MEIIKSCTSLQKQVTELEMEKLPHTASPPAPYMPDSGAIFFF
jgi:hypothetical protein